LTDVPGSEGIEFGTLGLYRLDDTQPSTHKDKSQDVADASAARPRVHCLSNPCTFQINELVFGVTSTDVLFQMSAEEANANLPPGSRLRRIAQHLIQQESYYPLFPPNKSVNLDLKRQEGWKMPCRPDVLIIPSKLTPFCAPVLENTMVINPGHLTKGTTGGTYAIMEIPPIPRDTLDEAIDSVQLPHNVQDRIQVQVKRI
jgi:DNA polymerase alpha subunit B